MLRPSLRLWESALLIGMIALMSGMNVPTMNAFIIDHVDGTIEELSIISGVNMILQAIHIKGKLRRNPSNTAGTTQNTACVKMRPTNPFFVSPTSLMTAKSNVLDSTESSRSEQMSRHEIIMNMMRRTSNMTKEWTLKRLLSLQEWMMKTKTKTKMTTKR